MPRSQRIRLWRAARLRTPKLPFPPRVFQTQRAPRASVVGVGPDEPAEWWTGTRPEWWVYQWIIRRGLILGIDFLYQSEVFGGRVPFGAIVDFWFPRYGQHGMVWRLQGYYWHYRVGREALQRDLNSRIRLEASGTHVVDILDLDIEDPENRERILSAAIDGLEMIELSLHLAANVG